MNKAILKIGVLGFSIVGCFFVNISNINADCTLTSTNGTDGRCFSQDGEYICLERAEDQHCFVSDEGGGGTIDPVVGG
jgi:hypothetical protein